MREAVVWLNKNPGNADALPGLIASRRLAWCVAEIRHFGLMEMCFSLACFSALTGSTILASCTQELR